MDLAKTLIRSTARSFYDTKHVLVIDALMIHSVLPPEDLALLLGMQTRDLRMSSAKLKEDRLLATHTQLEIRDGMMKPISRDYYYVDFHAAIDAIKYRIYRLTAEVKERYKPTMEKKDYFCPRCKAQWTKFEVLDKVTPMGFQCHRCGNLLEEEERQEGEITGHETHTKLMTQLASSLDMLKQIDSMDIPKNDFAAAMALQVPVPRESNVNPLRPYQPSNVKGVGATAARMMTTTTALDVSIAPTSELSAAEKAAEAQRKADVAAQNALPVWHTKSTVINEPTANAPIASEIQDNGVPHLKEEEDVKDIDPSTNDEVAAYYQQMEREREKEAQDEREDGDTSGGEDEFEDVEVDRPYSQTPPKPNPAYTNGVTGSKQKGKDSETEGSTPATNASTPAQGEAEAPAPKKVKFEDIPAVDENGKEDSDEDENADFEDV